LSVSETVAQDTSVSQTVPEDTSVSETAPQDTSVSETVPQDTSRKTLIINGATVNAAVIQVEGRSYVDIEGLTEALRGSVTFDPSRIELTIPAPTVARAAQDSAEMSKQFQQMAVVTLAEMREWKGAVAYTVATGMPVAGTWSQEFRNRIEADLMKTELAVSTDADHQAFQLLNQELALLSEWAEKVLGEREALNGARSVDPNALQEDQELAKISQCGEFLSWMIVSGTFSDDSSCH
jgi:hypothetical protein